VKDIRKCSVESFAIGQFAVISFAYFDVVVVAAPFGILNMASVLFENGNECLSFCFCFLSIFILLFFFSP